MDGRWQRWVWNAGIPVLLLLVTLIPRVMTLGSLTNPDELGWLNRSVQFYDALSRREWSDTLQAFHPGVVPMWGFGAMMTARYGLEQLQAWLAAGALPMADLARAALWFPVAIAVLTVLAVYGLVRRLAGREAGLYAALLLAVSPYYLVFAHVIHMDLVHASLMIVAALLWINYLYRPRRWYYLVGSGVVSGLAMLTRTASLYLIPFGVLAVGAFFLSDNLSAGQRRLDAGWARWIGQTALAWLAWLSVLFLTIFALWPALWANPASVIDLLMVGITRSVENAHPAPMFLQGEIITEDPGILYYGLVLLFRLRPVTLILALLNPVVLILAWSRIQPEKRAAWLLGLAYPLFYFVQMSLATHKLGRYMLPVGIALNILAGISLAVGARWLTKLIARSREPSFIRALRQAVLGGLILLLALPWLRLAPYFSAYYSPLAGGSQQAVQVLTMDSGLGLSQAAAYLDEKPGAEGWLVPSFYHYVFQHYFRGQTQRPNRESWAGLPVEAQYVVLTEGQVQRDIYPATLDFFLPREPEHTISIDGIEYVSIYRVPRRELDASPPVQVPLEASFEGRVHLLGYDTSRLEDALLVTLYWRPITSMHRELRVTLRLIDAAGRVIHELNDPPWSGDVTVFQWPDGLAVQDQHTIPLAADLPPGDYRLAITLGQRYEDGHERPLPLEGSEETELVLEPVKVPPLPEPSRSVAEGNLGGLVRLLGYDAPQPLQVSAGATLPLTWTWEVLANMEADYTVFVHLAGADGQPVAQADSQPFGGTYPTSFWDVGERLADPHLLEIPAGVLPGDYELLVGMYLLSSGERLPLVGADGQVLGDSISLGRVQVPVP
jgi:4-amino-4-deoxy-L-arabinose transferase-like glycosyltransferase